MPLLKRKRFEPVKTPVYDETKKESRNSTAWYLPSSKEIFTDYSEYLKRISLYRRPIWQCEFTGKSSLTFKQALESEKAEKERVSDKLPEPLQKRVLMHLQFQTSRLDAVVDNVYQQFVNRFVKGEPVNCVWDDNHTYNARILEENVQPEKDGKEDTADIEYYKVQLIDENSEGIDQDDCIKIVSADKIKRDRFAFSKNFLKKFIKEYTTKDTYIGAPWIIREDMAEKFNIDTTLPDDLQVARDKVYMKSRKKRNEANASLAAEANRNATEDQVLPSIDTKKVEGILKYPMEDLNVPVYRRDPSGLGKITDMTPGTPNANAEAQNPTGGMPLYPSPKTQSVVPDDCFGSFLMVWSFLNVFSQPLKLSPFSLDDFENALSYPGNSSIMTESNVALLNAIIKQRDRLKKESLGHGSTAMAAALSLYGSGYQASRSNLPSSGHPYSSEPSSQYNSEDEDDQHVWKARPAIQRRESIVERGCGSAEVEAVGSNWDNGTVDTAEERIGWEDILIGFVNQLAPMELLDDLDRILSTLVPSSSSTLEEREEAYATLSIRDKIKLFELLLSVANESFVIKNYLDECQEQMTELRKQKIDISREKKRIHAERRELDEKQNDENNHLLENQGLDSSSSDSEDNLDASDDEDSDLRRAQRQAEHLSRHESRQAAMKRHQAEREQREAKRMKLHHLQREEARARNQEIKIRNEARKRLDEDERAVLRKDEQVERDLRKYNTHRIKPLGRDKFYNRYYYLDDIGGTLLHGSGKLFVQCPSDTDIYILQERDFEESIDKTIPLPCGRGGGIKFVKQLMEAQGFGSEAKFLLERIEALKTGDTIKAKEWWHCYAEPEDIQKLLEWLNPKGVREFRLKREIEKQLSNIMNGMKKRAADQASLNKFETTRRNTRSKAIPQFPPGSWLAYVNKLA
ncbi:ATP-utilizing chromatin assembly and remodelling N-terminal-domain-containing protein [Choanephora cucurbitarum]|nr:ATP-utilizing chromatin assembly and remodelling N-terminal-domain-containing protein [Choanephora cucurbitarum]